MLIIFLKELDSVQVENSHFIETAEREHLADFFNEVAEMVNINEYDDITWLWRKEW